MKQWFSDFKKKVVKHVSNGKHIEQSASYLDRFAKSAPLKTQVRQNMRYLAYYLLYTNTAFELWPYLLAVCNRATVAIGNLNQSRKFVTKATGGVRGPKKVFFDIIVSQRVEQDAKNRIKNYYS